MVFDPLVSHGTKKAVGLLSGGLDSSVAILSAQRYDMDVVLALTVDYGQPAARQEIARAQHFCRTFEIAHESVSLPLYPQGMSQILFDNKTLPQPRLADLSNPSFTRNSARAVWVPNRNGLLIEYAAARAEVLGAQAVVVGFNREEAETFPDNSIEYLSAITHALSFSTRNQVSVWSPTAGFSKMEIVEKAIEEGLPFDTLWSCYRDGEKMCGRCESCMRLKRALGLNKVSKNELFIDASL